MDKQMVTPQKAKFNPLAPSPVTSEPPQENYTNMHRNDDYISEPI